MGEEGGFLHAIQSDPWDEVSRAVYADWLEERGDPRGAYLRAESASAALGFKQPRARADRAKAAATITHYQSLRKGLDPAWLALVARPDWFLLRGGRAQSIGECLRGTAKLWRDFADKDPHREHQVVVYALRGNRHGIRSFPILAPCWHCDLLGWLADPRYNRGVIRACGWLTSPRTGIRYFFTVPEGDVGSEFVAVYAAGGRCVVFDRTDGHLTASARRGIPHVQEPRLALASARQVAVLTMIAAAEGPPSALDFQELSNVT
jgi:uncharacterized protein (TIGR02996 family)